MLLRSLLILLSLPSPLAAQTQSFKLVEAGRFQMGYDGNRSGIERDFPKCAVQQFYTNEEKPRHWTWITKPFSIATTEVTVGQFAAFVKATGYKTDAEKSGEGSIGWSPSDKDTPNYKSWTTRRKPEFTWRSPGFEQTDAHPIVCVSWNDAQVYCQWLSKKEDVVYRLPTEAEWEKACRAGTETYYSFGDTMRQTIHKHANIANMELEREYPRSAMRRWLVHPDFDPPDPHLHTAPVGSYPANPLGIYDMHGNVWEWCQDFALDTWYKQYAGKSTEPIKVAVDPINTSEKQSKSSNFHSIRGGSWYNGPLQARSSARAYFDQDDSACYIGFRVVRDDAPTGAVRRGKALYTLEQAELQLLKDRNVRIHTLNRGNPYVDVDRAVKLDVELAAALTRVPGIERLTISVHNDSVLDNAILEQLAKAKSLRFLSISGSIDQ